MALRLPRAAEREYLAIYGIAAIYVAELPSGHTLVSSSCDLLRSLLALRRKFSSGHIACAYWVKNHNDARRIARQVEADLFTSEASAILAQHRIEAVAAQLGIPITEHDAVLLRARLAVAYIERKIDEAHDNGELRWFNQEYRAWRIEAKQHGRSMSYAHARARLRQKIFRDILSHPVTYELFPPLRTLNLH